MVHSRHQALLPQYVHACKLYKTHSQQPVLQETHAQLVSMEPRVEGGSVNVLSPALHMLRPRSMAAGLVESTNTDSIYQCLTQ